MFVAFVYAEITVLYDMGDRWTNERAGSNPSLAPMMSLAGCLSVS